MRRLSSQVVWPRTVINVYDAGSECDITLVPGTHTRLCLTRAQARRLANALLRFADAAASKNGDGE